jgi:hypothetical protein
MSGIKYNSGVSNYKSTPYAISDTYANLVNYLPNIVGALYFANDGTSETILQADGTTWIPISSAPGAGSNLQQVTNIGASSDNSLQLTGPSGIYVDNILPLYSLGLGNHAGDGAGFFAEMAIDFSGAEFGIGQYSGFGNGLLFNLNDNLSKITTNIGGSENGLRLDFATETYIIGQYLGADNRLYMDGGTGAASFKFDNLITCIASNLFFYIDGSNEKIYTETSGTLIGLNLDFAANVYTLGDYNLSAGETFIQINDSGSQIFFNALDGLYKFTGVLTFASNALAIAGGLTVGNIYKSASGTLSIVI